MKPYTLEWWLSQLNLAAFIAGQGANRGIEYRMIALSGWIRRRIVRKYGERPE